MPVIIVLLAAIILVLLVYLKSKSKRLLIACLIGLALTIISFYVFLIFIFSIYRAVLWLLLGLFYISVIIFLVLWNLKDGKKVYLVLLFPLVCIIAGISIIYYNDYVSNIPTLNEDNILLYNYEPFTENNHLVKLDEESDLKLTENLPVLDGATALYPVYASFAQTVYPEGKYDHSQEPVFCNKTDSAYENLFEGKADIIFCAEPSKQQLKQFNDSGKKLKLVPIGREAFVFFVNKENTVENLTIDNIRGIYSGKVRNWKELHGINQKIRAFQRPENSGSQTIFEKIMGSIPIIKPLRENVSRGMGDIINQVAVYRNFPNAIGYSFLYFSTEMLSNNRIKLLSIDGVYPSVRTIQDNTYPFSGNFYAIYIDSDEINKNVKPFIDWILSRQGQALIAKTGYTPIKQE